MPCRPPRDPATPNARIGRDARLGHRSDRCPVVIDRPRGGPVRLVPRVTTDYNARPMKPVSPHCFVAQGAVIRRGPIASRFR